MGKWAQIDDKRKVRRPSPFPLLFAVIKEVSQYTLVDFTMTPEDVKYKPPTIAQQRFPASSVPFQPLPLSISPLCHKLGAKMSGSRRPRMRGPHAEGPSTRDGIQSGTDDCIVPVQAEAADCIVPVQAEAADCIVPVQAEAADAEEAEMEAEEAEMEVEEVEDGNWWNVPIAKLARFLKMVKKSIKNPNGDYDPERKWNLARVHFVSILDVVYLRCVWNDVQTGQECDDDSWHTLSDFNYLNMLAPAVMQAALAVSPRAVLQVALKADASRGVVGKTLKKSLQQTLCKSTVPVNTYL
jgi:hypothetical protein